MTIQHITSDWQSLCKNGDVVYAVFREWGCSDRMSSWTKFNVTNGEGLSDFERDAFEVEITTLFGKMQNKADLISLLKNYPALAAALDYFQDDCLDEMQPGFAKQVLLTKEVCSEDVIARQDALLRFLEQGAAEAVEVDLPTGLVE